MSDQKSTIKKINIGDLVTWEIILGSPPALRKEYAGIVVEVKDNFMGGKNRILRVLVDGEIIEVSSINGSLQRMEDQNA